MNVTPLPLQVLVPRAQIADLLPAVQLAAAASRPGTDYGAAKARFLEAIQVGGLGGGVGGGCRYQPKLNQNQRKRAERRQRR